MHDGLVYIYGKMITAIGSANIPHTDTIKGKERKREKKEVSPCDENS